MKELEEFINNYKELRECKQAIKSIEPNYFFNTVDMLLNYIENSIPKEKVEETFEYIEDYVERLNGPDEDIEYIKNKKQELLEGK